jgi:peptidoglycan/xylan/chitin deacetylase (PgdA/CDA1 family)
MPGISASKIAIPFGRSSQYWTQPYFKDGTQFDNGKVVLGFDDNWDSVYSNAFPVLQSKGVPAVIYVNGSLVANNPYHGFNTSSWAQLREMHAAGIDIQCHGYTGQQIQLLTDQQLIDELVNNNTAFVANGLPLPEHIAYSVGGFSDHAIGIVDNYRKSGRTTYNGYVDRKSPKYTLPAYDMPTFTLNQLKGFMDIAKANKQAVRFYGHMVGVVDALSMTTQMLEDVIDYGQSIGLDFITNKELYNLMYYIDLRFSRPTSSDTQIDIICKNKLGSSDSISIERSIDGVNFTEIHTMLANVTDYADTGLDVNTNYYYRVRGFKGSKYLPYSQIENISTAVTMTLATVGNGTGVSAISLRTFNDVFLTLDGTAKFYTDAAGTLGESSSVQISKAIPYTIYLKCPSGTANLKFSSNKITQVINWVSGANAAWLTGDLTIFNLLNYIAVGGNNTLSVNVINLINLTYYSCVLGGTLSGSIELLTKLTYLYAPSAVSTYLCTITGDFSKISSTLTYLYLPKCNISTYTGGANWSALLASVEIDTNIGYGLSSIAVDALINDVNDTKVTGRAINVLLKGSNSVRTSNSDAARLAIVADGGSVTTIGAETITNGTFDNAGDGWAQWELGHWTFTGGKANYTNGLSTGIIRQVTIDAGSLYQIMLDISNCASAAWISVLLNGGPSVFTNALMPNNNVYNGEYRVEDIADQSCSGVNDFRLFGNTGSTNFSLDNLSIRKVLTT